VYIYIVLILSGGRLSGDRYFSRNGETIPKDKGTISIRAERAYWSRQEDCQQCCGDSDSSGSESICFGCWGTGKVTRVDRVYTLEELKILNTNKKMREAYIRIEQEAGELAREKKDRAISFKKAKKGTAPKGRQTIEGTIVSITMQASEYGRQLKMMVELGNRSTVWGTIPVKIFKDREAANGLAGLKIQFEAEFCPTAEDKTHAFFKRPTKVRVITNKQEA